MENVGSVGDAYYPGWPTDGDRESTIEGFPKGEARSGGALTPPELTALIEEVRKGVSGATGRDGYQIDSVTIEAHVQTPVTGGGPPVEALVKVRLNAVLPNRAGTVSPDFPRRPTLEGEAMPGER
jgi:hypothetical protein